MAEKELTIMDIQRCYDVLDIPVGSSLDEVKEAYKNKVAICHPDLFQDDKNRQKQSEDKTEEVDIAFKNLCELISKQEDSGATSNETSPAGGYQDDYSAYLEELDGCCPGEDIEEGNESEHYVLTQEEIEERERSEAIGVNHLDYFTQAELDDDRLDVEINEKEKDGLNNEEQPTTSNTSYGNNNYAKTEDEYLDRMSGGPQEDVNNLLHDTTKDKIDTSNDKRNHVELFTTAIRDIDKNLSKMEQFVGISNALDIIIDANQPMVQICFDNLKEEFGLIVRDIEAFRKELTAKKKEAARNRKIQEGNELIDQCNIKPKELTEQEKAAAIKWLKDPKLLDNIVSDIAKAGEIINEETNSMMLYLASVSRKLEKPLSLVIFGQSSSGKSYLANAIEQFIPPEDKFTLSSSSARAFEYLGEQLMHKCILIQEWEGIESILPTIRTLQSEGKLSRMSTVENPDDKSRIAIAKSFKCPCSVVVTTTKENIHDENSTRIFELYADESIQQTKKVVRATIDKENINHGIDKSLKEEVIELHRDAQRCLENIKVSVPYTDHLTFSSNATRNRRDSDRFMQLIKTIAFLRQKQKDVKVKGDTKYIEADLYDYEWAYRIGIGIIKNTINSISNRAKEVLTTCIALSEKLGKGVPFTVKQIQEEAPNLGFDFGNRTDLYKQLKDLTEKEYLDYDQAKKNGVKYYRVAFNPVRNTAGQIINIDNPDIKEITTPDELKEKIAYKQEETPVDTPLMI